jgi:hypothetical protein
MIGCIYQQTCIDTYAKVAFAKLSDHKTPIPATERRLMRTNSLQDLA